MPSNVEIKALVHDVAKLKNKAEKLSGGLGTHIPQEDVFFNVKSGRLKLRKLQGEDSQLIFYERTDDFGPKSSKYSITKVSDPCSLQNTLGQALGIKGVVKKLRTLYIVGQTRVHIDNVEGLGTYMELEVVMEEGQSVEEGTKIASNLMVSLGIEHKDLVSGAYMDLILKDKKSDGTKV